MNGKGNKATIVNGDTTVEVELRDDGVVALEFSCKGRPAIGLDVYGLPFATTVKSPSEVQVQFNARERPQKNG